ncbi:TetR/AcrR family transcriptional regulator [Streptomyces sp. A012304]|uniref:TetR/AcrR family transcriptional regulator n=1 Tax=Streptomyces sp. A012304 TaxID=375446 RepID=UPI00222F6457|nr:TetR/AcrR family transcriptional regulator [Streptomyces sp. A012304]GKQ40657.1 TetR family transcriptional regulator [Streptomyces sp. A012304]
MTVWERSRQLASQEILDAAVRLFTTQGYEETTTTQIAREAGVSQRTLYRYFGTKEDLLCGDQDELGALLRRTVEEQPAEVSAWQALRAGFVTLLSTHDSLERTRAVSTLIFRTPVLRAALMQKRLQWQTDLLPTMRARLLAAGREGIAAEHEARTVIAVSFACVDSATATWIQTGDSQDLVALYDEALAYARASA